MIPQRHLRPGGDNGTELALVRAGGRGSTHAIRQAGASGVVTALHQIPYGVVWSIAEIEARKALIEADPSLGLRWSVVESLPIHERIKLDEGDQTELFDNYRQSMRNLAPAASRRSATISCLCSTGPAPNCATRFPAAARRCASTPTSSRPSTASCWSARARKPIIRPRCSTRAKDWFDPRLGSATGDSFWPTSWPACRAPSTATTSRACARCSSATRTSTPRALRENLARFLREVIPTAEEVGIRMAIHPDDPPRPLMGLPRIVSNADDLAFILEAVDSPAMGSRSAAARWGRIPPTTCRPSPGTSPTGSSSRICATSPRSRTAPSWRRTISAATPTWWRWSTCCSRSRSAAGRGAPDWRLPLRPDHGHELLDDVGKGSFPAIRRSGG